MLLSSLLATTASASIPKECRLTPSRRRAPRRRSCVLEANRFVRSDWLAAAMNACVDGIVARDLDGAALHCDRAVARAAHERSAASTSIAVTASRRSTTAVPRGRRSRTARCSGGWKSDPTYASDLQRAQKLAPDLDFVQTNAAAFGDAPKTAASVVAR